MNISMSQYRQNKKGFALNILKMPNTALRPAFNTLIIETETEARYVYSHAIQC